MVSPGDTVTGSIPVTNTTDEPRIFRVYLGDWVRTGDSTGYELSDEGNPEPRSCREWVVYSPERATIEPGEERDIAYELHIPDDPSLSGSYWAMVYIEGIPEEEPDLEQVTEEGTVSIGVRTVFRYAIQIYTTIEGTEFREAAFATLNMEPTAESLNVTAVLENRGNVILQPDVWLELSNSAGETVYINEHDGHTVLPESARDFVFELRDLPIESGEYLVTVYADYGVPRLIAAQGRVNLNITPPEEPDEQPEETETEDETADAPAEDSA